METQLNELIGKKEWAKAAQIYDKLLTSTPNRDLLVKHLLERSECLLELACYETVVADCRKVIRLLAENCRDKFAHQARHKLVQALFMLRRFSEAELAAREWLSLLNNGIYSNLRVLQLMERLHLAMQAPDHKERLQAELMAFESNFVFPNVNGEEVKPVKMDNFGAVTCTYCNLLFKSKSDLRIHCQTEAHQTVIMSDDGRDWNFRPPPRGITSDSYKLCEDWKENACCRYGVQCVDAHGLEEFAEWKERFNYRQIKMQRAYEKELYGKSYTEELIEKWLQSQNPEDVMRSKINLADDYCCSNLVTTVCSKNSENEWNFTLISQKPLQTVALLHDAHRNHFELAQILVGGANFRPEETQTPFINVDIRNSQELFLPPESAQPQMTQYKIKIVFKTDIFGTFRQSVVFDFGSLPVLVKHLSVDVIPKDEIDKIQEIRQEMVLSSVERWTSSNADIFPFASEVVNVVSAFSYADNSWEKKLIHLYPCPQPGNFQLSHSTVNDKKTTKTNYKTRMHELLYVEEMARYDEVAKFNVKAKLHIIKSYILSPNGMAGSTAKYSNAGELFALLNLGQDLSEDTLGGRLVLNNCTTVLLAPVQEHSSVKTKVHEALIEDKGKNIIYLRLSANTVRHLQIADEQELLVQIQFQLNRIPYCEWHYAVDKMTDLKIIFPDTHLEPNIPWAPNLQWSSDIDTRLNPKQKEAVVAIVTPTYVPLPPILIIGPFGTGKTFTIAQAIKLLMQQPDTRVLICTHSNSAADLYIKDYLHPYVESGHEEARPLRIYYEKRWVATVNPVVQKYCLIEESSGLRTFQVPTLESIKKHRIVVVTLSTSIYLSSMGLPQGYFTHILLDEAAQSLECEAIMPLCLANQTTRIVLAGDHMQLSPELFSQFARDRNLHTSLLERLYDHYPVIFSCKILLCENYRAHEAIIHFTSELFYDQKLISSGKQPRHDQFYPLTFFTTRGEDLQDKNSTAFYNNSEVYEVIERVCELKKKWPESWGKMDEHAIGIMTPYADQVFRIRSELRKRRMGNISVERVLNVQGKQFRAVFLSTVRTRWTCANSKANEEVDYGFLSNSKLLNTAITRAQSLVAVVGDPITLCSIGRCSKVWEKFIQICHQNKSLYGITWSYLKNQLDGLELKKIYGLNPLAPEFVPRSFKVDKPLNPPQSMLPPIPPPPSFINRPAPPNAFIPNYVPVFPNFSNPSPIILPVNSWPVNLPETTPAPSSVLLPPGNFPLVTPRPNFTAPLPKAPPVSNVFLRPELPYAQKVESALDKMRINDEKSLDRDLIQFLDNVHFPEKCKPPESDPVLSDFTSLLPRNMSLAEMLSQPRTVHEQWYQRLYETKGIEAAKKFEYLVLTSRKKEVVPTVPTIANMIQSELAANPLRLLPENLTYLNRIHVPSNPMVQKPFIGRFPPNGGSSYLEQTTPNLSWFNKPTNQIDYQKPIYLKDIEALANLQLQEQCYSAAVHNDQRWFDYMNVAQQHCPNSVPLYQRRSTQLHPAQNVPRTCLELSADMANTQYIQNSPINARQHWQQQINQDFANLTFNNNETVEELFGSHHLGTT